MPRPKKHPSASAFVRSQPRAMPAKQVVAAAKKYGFVISDQLVYNVRSADGKRRPKAPRRSAPKNKAVRSDLTAADAALIRAATEVGLARARELLGRLERALGSAAG